jgi:hypothetical protein
MALGLGFEPSVLVKLLKINDAISMKQVDFDAMRNPASLMSYRANLKKGWATSAKLRPTGVVFLVLGGMLFGYASVHHQTWREVAGGVMLAFGFAAAIWSVVQNYLFVRSNPWRNKPRCA